jgi:hypothetical protein
MHALTRLSLALVSHLHSSAHSALTLFAAAVWTAFDDLFNVLPLAALVNRRILCVHGGIGRLESLDQVQCLDRNFETNSKVSEKRHIDKIYCARCEYLKIFICTLFIMKTHGVVSIFPFVDACLSDRLVSSRPPCTAASRPNPTHPPRQIHVRAHIAQIRAVPRPTRVEHDAAKGDPVLMDILWSDPAESDADRGIQVLFVARVCVLLYGSLTQISNLH